MKNKKTILITGASFGIGKEIATTFAKENYNVIITYKNSKKESLILSEELSLKYNIECTSYYLDITKENSIKKLYKNIIKKYKNIDILINNAAVDNYDNLLDKKTKDIKNVINTNLIGTFLMIKYYELNKNKGTIISLASTDGINTYTPERFEYCASKAAIINMTKSLSMALKNKIYSISPNWVKTESVLEMNPNELKKELKRINQKNLIDPIIISNKIKEIITKDIPTGENIIIEGEKDEY